ncbi:xylosidase/arabinosidase [Stieleria mannarensis]|uniref:xylosidase/arabinosidase n=1 Tax=Stieleria mannarensis TaxID=2755585 RepID=UPI0016030701|nr:xylosidase/arabinosidase [Rhodopirellula sp. JC639]
MRTLFFIALSVTLVRMAPAQEAPAQEAPAQEAPAQEAPAQEAPAQEASAQQESAQQVVDRTTLTGKVMCGYQGWFNCEADGANLGWTHWAKRRDRPFEPGNVTVDLWPDLTESAEHERFATGFKHADGRTAEVFSSTNRDTVVRHFRWMQQYGIDGVFVQRFANGLSNPVSLRHKNNVLSHAREGANLAGRAFAVMYDLSGLRAGQVSRVRDDWVRMQTEMEITRDPAYLHHEDRPVVAIWGIGFSDDRKYSLTECLELVQWLKSEGCTVMLGVPSYWRDGTRDAVDDPLLHRILETADILSPWSVGRYRTPAQATRHAADVWDRDRQWCDERRIDFLPVVFPGFSWHNLTGDPLDSIPRLKGQFLWSQFVAAKRAGCQMVYVAMFDEVDEGTAIFKCTNDPPVGEDVRFLTYEGLPSDYYLKLVGQGGKLLRDEIPLSEKFR